MVLEQVTIRMQKYEHQLKSHTWYNISSKWIKDLNKKCGTIELLEEIKGKPFGSKGHFKGVKILAINGEKTFANLVSAEGLVCRIRNTLKSTLKMNNPVRKTGKRQEKRLS